MKMRTLVKNELNHAVSLLNFEQENKEVAKRILRYRYNIPMNFINLVSHKIFFRLSNWEFSHSSIRRRSFWDQFHQIAREEVKLIEQ